MTLIAAPNEACPVDQRTAMTPANATKLIGFGADVHVESGLGSGCGYSDEQYREAGARVSTDRKNLFSQADLILRVHKPSIDEIALLKEGAIHVSFLDPFTERDLVRALQDRKITSISMEMIPRTTRAQKMDALSSQASLAGYVMEIGRAHV